MSDRARLLLALFASLAAVATVHSACGGDNGTPAPDGGPTGSLKRDAGADVDLGDGETPDATDDGAGESAAALLLNDTFWIPVENNKVCPLYEAVTVPDPFPRRTWRGCGTGCSVTESMLPLAEANIVNSLTSSGGYVHGDAFLSLSMAAGISDFVQILRLSDGATVAAVESRDFKSHCVFSGKGGDAPFVVMPFKTDAGMLYGRASSVPGARWSWQKSWLDTGIVMGTFDFDDGYGFALYTGTIAMFTSPNDVSARPLDAGTSSGQMVSARRGLLAWASATANGGALGGYTADGGVVDLIGPQALETWAVRLSEDRMVWIGVNHPSSGPFTDAQWFWSPYATRASDVVVHAGPSIPAITGLGEVATGGDYAAAIGCDTSGQRSNCQLIVLRMSTGQQWVLPHRPGNAYQRLLAVSPTEIVAGEIESPTTDPAHFQQIMTLLRIDVSHLDEVRAAWQ